MLCNKVPACIRKVTVSENSFPWQGESFEPTLVNFFYGANGTGKSTVAESIATGSNCKYEDSKTFDDFQIYLYNQEYINRNFKQFCNLPGVFSLSEDNNDLLDKIASLDKDISELEKYRKTLTMQIEQKEKEIKAPWGTFIQTCWDQTAPIRTEFQNSLSGYRNSKEKFATEAVKRLPDPSVDYGELQRLYQTVYSSSADSMQKLFEIPDLQVLDRISSAAILKEPILPTESTQFSEFLSSLKALDWFKDAHSKFHGETDGRCPYCQQYLPLDFEEEVERVFDNTYQSKITEIKSVGTTLKETRARLLSDLSSTEQYIQGLPDSIATPSEKSQFQDKLNLLRSETDAHLHLIADKVYNSSQSIEIPTTEDSLSEIQLLIQTINSRIDEFNKVISQKRTNEKKCKQAVWSLIASSIGQIKIQYQEEEKRTKTELDDLKSERNRIAKLIGEKKSEITELKGQTTNKEQAIQSMNLILKDCGFTGFYLEDNPSDENTYRVMRHDGSPAVNVSEGEKNFISFLYFYHTLWGESQDEDGQKEKIVIIDDPVSSMDSSVMFIVCSLVRELIEICENNYSHDIPGHTTSNFIKQMFILTHNGFFHREITFNQERNFEFVDFYHIRKIDNVSSIQYCVKSDDNHAGDPVNYNPVKDSYSALWEQFKESKNSLVLLNVCRQILEHYFLHQCGYDGHSIVDTLLRDGKNKESFIPETADGTKDYTKFHLAQSMVSYLSANERNRMDGMNYVEDTTDPDVMRDTFKQIFSVLGQDQHYQMMMGA